MNPIDESPMVGILSRKTIDHRESITRLEQKLSKSPYQVTPDVKHHFADGMYGREIHIKRGCTLTGKIHKHSCINTLLKGVITVRTEEGLIKLTAPQIFVSPAGVKRAGYAHSDVIWVTYHHTYCTDPKLIEEEVIAKDFQEYDEFVKLLEQ